MVCLTVATACTSFQTQAKARLHLPLKSPNFGTNLDIKVGLTQKPPTLIGILVYR
jgi:hypothetical protein